ncbi:hypothetical protein O9H85_30545 [Paenibacillus filicis]|uniref:Oxidoreductase N-terminal domain-containing protein n=1 Tax=Paenibacillus gyeongsangnamensis TaxID=3388067 RepID=A0ABT4QIE2_9BACL|nr:hypothetical protein [Paenibacillus filicis]MCZ8516649.1 hypothetical protein [Paenibacillus filicis]
MSAVKGKELRLKNRPNDRVRMEDFGIATVEIPEVQDGQVLVKNKFLSLDAGMRLRMLDLNMPIPLYAVGEPMYGDAGRRGYRFQGCFLAAGRYGETSNGMAGIRAC